MSFNFISAHDPRTRFVVEIPTDDGGVKEFNVPRMDFVSDEVFTDYVKWERENSEDKLIKQGKRPVGEAFDYLIEKLKIKDYKYFQKNLVFGEKLQLWQEWNRISRITLGESDTSSD